jgi:hypothetical protein
MRISLTVILAALLAALSVETAAGPLRIALLANVIVDGDTVLLANLLPQAAPLRLRAAAEQVSLGAAPQIGSERQFSRQTVVAAIASAGLPPSQFIIPAQITSRRENQSIPSTEIFSAIQTALANNLDGADLPNLAQLQPTDLHHAAAIPAPLGYSGLEVTQVAFDPAINRMRFRLLPKAPGRALPFYVTANLPATYASSSSVPSAHASAGSIPSAVLRSSSRAASAVPLSPPLVTTNQPARLHLHSADLDMLVEVRPLQRGYLDQVVRVRLAATGRTMQARVVAYGYLDATL